MVVRVTDSNGNPAANVAVDWSSTSGSLISQTVTNAEGYTQNVVFAQSLPNSNAFQSFSQYVVTASTATASATFYETVATPSAINFGVNPIQVFPIDVPVGAQFTGQVGTTGAPIQLRVSDDKGNRIPNVALFLVNNQLPTEGPTVTCQSGPGAGENTVLTDATGTASCIPIFGGTPNVPGQFSVLVGGGYPGGDPNETPRGNWNSLPIGLLVTPGVPGSVTITAGNSQSVNPGTVLPVALQVQVKSPSGSPLGAQQVRWTISPASAGSLGAATTVSDVNGFTSNTVNIASTAPGGAVTVTASSVADPSKSASFTITVVPLITITGFQIYSGNNQSASVNTAFPLPLVVQVTTSGSLANVPVQFTASGPISLSANTATTDATGRAQVTVTAGSVTGPATVTATVASATGTGSQTFNLTVLPPAPNVTASSFVNGADRQANSFSPCSIAAMVAPANTFPVQASPTVLGLPLSNTAVRVLVNGVSAPVLNVGATADGRQQVLFQVPCETATGNATVGVNAGGGTTSVTLNIQAASPGIFETVYSDGVLRPVLIRPDGSFVTLANPARRGENIVALVTGLGATSASVGTNSVPAPGSTSTPTGTVIVGMSGGSVPLMSAKRSEDLPGVFLVTFQVPSDMATGNNVPFSIGVIPSGSSTVIYSATAGVPVQ